METIDPSGPKESPPIISLCLYCFHGVIMETIDPSGRKKSPPIISLRL